MLLNNKSGHALITLMLSTSISCIILGAILHYLQVLYITYIEHIKTLENQQQKVLTLQYLVRDIHNSGFNYCHSNFDSLNANNTHTPPVSSCNVDDNLCTTLLPLDIQQKIAGQIIMPNSDILILNNLPLNFQILADGTTECTPLTVLYYLRRSVISEFKDRYIYALYRDDMIHNAVAITEGFTQFKIAIRQVAAYQAVAINLKPYSSADLDVELTTRNRAID